MTEELAGKTALVTGAARGIGAAVAKSLANAGGRLILCDQRHTTETLNGIKELGGDVRQQIADVSSEVSVASLFKSISETEGSLDFVINAAGILSESKITEIPTAEFDRVLSVNLRGSFLIARGAAQIMKPAKSGRIIFVSSELAYLGRANLSAYCASKAGVVLTRALARELAPDITVNSAAQWSTSNVRLENMSQEWIDKEIDIPLERIASQVKLRRLFVSVVQMLIFHWANT